MLQKKYMTNLVFSHVSLFCFERKVGAL